ncbi:hypothetical protein AB0H71_17000 [Nocardia sp. NPDC050697]|uniref:TRADD-N-associated membrane domain-containing protein n=1 Tax=Nocardia sp. NPDC050697 TaxID=3155158 RepID=UPI0033F8A0CC
MTSTADARNELPGVSTETAQTRPDDPTGPTFRESPEHTGSDESTSLDESEVDVKDRSVSTATETYFRAVILGLGVLTTICAILIPAFGREISSRYEIIVLVLGPLLISMAMIPPGASRRLRRALASVGDTLQPIEAPTPPFIINASDNAQIRVDSVGSDVSMIRTSESLQKQEQILRDMYFQGLRQAKRSFNVSLIAAVAGGCLLLWGVFLAISNAPTPAGQDYASVVAVGAGIVINILSSIFFIQSNRARRDMAQQGLLLREESQETDASPQRGSWSVVFNKTTSATWYVPTSL